MTDHTIPPCELVEQWASEKCYDERNWLYELHIAARAAQWGSDQELEACCAWLSNHNWRSVEPALRAARRSKPPSLKEQALEELEKWREVIGVPQLDIIHRALEQLDD